MADNRQITGHPSRRTLPAGWMVAIIATLILLADQFIKVWVKLHFYLGEEYPIFSWFRLKFIENNGMAFGMELSSKLFLTFGRISAVALFIWFVTRIANMKNIRRGFLVAMALVIAGAAGNVFDCVFYGEIFNNPMPPAIAEAFPPGGGYSGWFEGKVVDMFYFPFFSFIWPAWMPVVGGTEFEFFQYIFNLADASICVGVALIIFIYSKDATLAFHDIAAKSEKSGKSGK